MVVFATTVFCLCFEKSPSDFAIGGIPTGSGASFHPHKSLRLWKFCFYLGALFSMLQAALYIRYFVAGGSYYDLYLLGRDPVGFPGLSFLSSLLFFGYLGVLTFSECPQEVSTKWTIAFVFLSMLLLSRGRRGEIFTQILVGLWLHGFSKRKKLALKGWIGLGGTLVVIAELVGRLRAGSIEVAKIPLPSLFKWFIFSQGVSGELVAPSYEQFGVGLGNVRFIVMPLLGPLRRIFDPAYGIQSARSGEASGLLADELTYRVAPHFYLSGHGSGSSYLAETFCAFGIVGVVLSTILITWLVRSTPAYARKSPAVQFVFAAMLPYLLFVPRESFSFFVVPALKAIGLLLFATLLKESSYQSNRSCADV